MPENKFMMSSVNHCLRFYLYDNINKLCFEKRKTMKKICFIFGVCLIFAACRTNDVEQSEIKAFRNDVLVTNNVYESDDVRYRQNIAIKNQGDDFVTYEYKDVRIDELAPLAIKYCEENSQNKQAYLREIVLYRNNLRRATFDCISLAKDE